MIIFSRKTHGCWGNPPFRETPIDHQAWPPGTTTLRFPVGGWRLAPRSHCQKTSCQGEGLFCQLSYSPHHFFRGVLDETKPMIRVLKLSNFQIAQKNLEVLPFAKELQQKYGDIWWKSTESIHAPPEPDRIDKGFWSPSLHPTLATTLNVGNPYDNRG